MNEIGGANCAISLSKTRKSLLIFVQEHRVFFRASKLKCCECCTIAQSPQAVAWTKQPTLWSRQKAGPRSIDAACCRHLQVRELAVPHENAVDPRVDSSDCRRCSEFMRWKDCTGLAFCAELGIVPVCYACPHNFLCGTVTMSTYCSLLALHFSNFSLCPTYGAPVYFKALEFCHQVFHAVAHHLACNCLVHFQT